MDVDIDSNDGQGRTAPPHFPWIPAELLGLIFEHIPPDDSSMHRLRGELALSHVSQYWREVALTTPRLWTHITIHSNRSLKSAWYYLKRSGLRLPLHFDVDIYKYDKLIAAKSRKKLSLFRSILASYLAEHIHQIQCLSFLCFHKETLAFVLAAISEAPAPHLQQLILKFEVSSNQQPWLNAPTFLNRKGAASRLRFLDTDMLATSSNLNYFENLTTLYLHELEGVGHQTYSSFVEMLRALEALQYLSLRGKINLANWPLHLHGPQFLLPNLRGLRLLEEGMMAVKFILSLNAPQLESLWLDCSFDGFQHLFESPQVITGPKFPALKYLTIPNDNLYLCSQFSRFCPTITHLYFPHADFYHSSKLQDALVAGWPSLHTLVFSMFRERNSKSLYTALANAFSRRRANHRAIKYLLVERDQMEGIPSGIMNQVQVALIDPIMYREPWWNKLDQQVVEVIEQ